MLRLLRSTIFTSTILTSSILIGGCALSQAAPQAASITPDNGSTSQNQTSQNQGSGPGLTPAELPRGKTSLVRGVLKRLDPVHDQLLIHAFGGGDGRVALAPRTQMLSGLSCTHFSTP